MSARPAGAEVAIAGGGLVGSLLAVFLVRRGFEVTVYERRPDPRVREAAGGRSINLVVTSRGIHALRQAGLWNEIAAACVRVTGRMMHGPTGELSYQPYGRDETECNWSISRAGLNRLLLGAAERAGARLCFERRLMAADPEKGVLRFGDDTVRASLLVGADGAGSALRAAMRERPGFVESIEELEHGYKELTVPAGSDGAFLMQADALHIWPRGHFMLMGLPNLDGSFTATLYLPLRGPGSFEELETPDAVVRFFQTRFPDAVALIPDLGREFLDNPTGRLATVRCEPWHHSTGALLIGDAAHAIVPFFGQGMNCGFEDCTVLDGLIERHGPDRERVLNGYTRQRKPDADAIADMALENFVEMRDRVGDPAFRLRKQVEHRLEVEMPREFRSRYSMVTYSTIPYAVAREAGRIQDGILDRLCEGLRSADELNLDRARELIRERLAPYLAERSVSLDY